MLQVFQHANFRIMYGTKVFGLGFSALVMLLAIGTMVVKGFNYGIDFAGGTAVQVRFATEPNLDHLRESLERAGLGDVTIQRIGDPKDHEVLVRVERAAGAAEGDEGGEVSARVIGAIKNLEGEPEAEVRGVDFVGPTAGRELMTNTLWAIFGSVVGILGYVWFRFHRVAWGMSAVLALVHDVTIAAGAMSFTGKEFSLTVVAALLAIVGYSINDTIVVMDRIRENLRLYRDHDFERVVNASVNQTLSRTILTSFTVFIAVVALLMYGGDKLNPMSFCLVVGIVFGTYSSIWVAAGLLVLAHKFLGARYVKA